MYPRHTWTSWAPVPLWIAQMFFTLDAIASLGLIMLELEGEEKEAHIPVAWQIYLVLLFICFLVPALEIGLYFVRLLHPWTYLVLQISKSAWLMLYLVLTCSTMIVHPVLELQVVWNIWKLWQVIAVGLALAACLGSLIYGIVVLVRLRRRGLVYDRVEKNRSPQDGRI